MAGGGGALSGSPKGGGRREKRAHPQTPCRIKRPTRSSSLPEEQHAVALSPLRARIWCINLPACSPGILCRETPPREIPLRSISDPQVRILPYPGEIPPGVRLVGPAASTWVMARRSDRFFCDDKIKPIFPVPNHSSKKEWIIDGRCRSNRAVCVKEEGQPKILVVI